MRLGRGGGLDHVGLCDRGTSSWVFSPKARGSRFEL